MKKKSVYWITGILISPVILFILISVLLCLPPVQRWAVGVATSYASKATGMQISIDDVRLKFPLDIKIDGVRVFRQNDSIKTKTDTILMAGSIVADVQFRPLLDGRVEVNALNLEKIKVNTSGFIHKLRIKGTLAHLQLQSHCLNLNTDTLMLNDTYIKGANVDVALSDTVPDDTTKSDNKWKIRFDNLLVENSSVNVHLPNDTISIGASITKLSAFRGFFDLQRPSYKIKQASIHASYVTYDNKYAPRCKGLDPDHILIANTIINVDDFDFADHKLSAFVKNCRMKERCGVYISNLTSHVRLDTASIHLPDFALKTPNSRINMIVDLDFSVLESNSKGQLKCDINASIGKQDRVTLITSLPEEVRRSIPTQPLSIVGKLSGNLDRLDLDGFNIQLPTVFRCRLDGWLSNIHKVKHLSGQLNIDATTYHLAPVLSAFISNSLNGNISFNIPDGITAKGKVLVSDLTKFNADIAVTEGGGSLKGNAHLDLSNLAYGAKLVANSINIGHFLKGLGLGPASGSITANGKGINLFTKSTSMKVDAKLQKLKFEKYDFDGAVARINVSGGRCHVDFDSRNKLLYGNIDLDAFLRGKNIEGTISADISNIDFYRLGLVRDPLNLSICCHIDGATNNRDYYSVMGLISDITIRDSSKVYRPDDIVLNILTDRYKTEGVVDCGDFHLNSEFEGGYSHLMNTSNRLLAEIHRQMRLKMQDDMALRKMLPEGHLMLHSGRFNPIARCLRYVKIDFARVSIDLTSSAKAGPNGTVDIDTLKLGDDLQLDMINLKFNSDIDRINYNLLVENGPDNPQVSFRGLSEGSLDDNGLNAAVHVYDNRNVLGLQLGIQADLLDRGLHVHFNDSIKTILGYKTFTVNKDNRIFLRDDNRLSAKLLIESEKEGMGLHVYSDDEDKQALQNITLSLSNFELSQFTSVIPYMPKISGVMNSDFHIIKTKENITVSSDVRVRNMVFEGCAMDNMETEFVYMPIGENTHTIDGVIFSNDKEVATLKGTYDTRGEGNIEADLALEKFPLDYVNGFIPDQIIGFDGNGDGELTIKGSLSHPDVNGEVYLDSSRLFSLPYGVDMRFDNDPVRIVSSKLLLENFEMYANNNQPLLCQGEFDFSDTDHMRLDVKMKASNFLAIDAKENKRSEAYGRGYVNMTGSIEGELDRLHVRGKVEILDKSDLFYIIRDSPVTTDNSLKELVTFTDFRNGDPIIEIKPKVEGMDIGLNIKIASGTRLKCWLNTDHTNYIDLIGEGQLWLWYTTEKIRMWGKCTMMQGEMKYSLPVIPLQTFKIEEGSFVQFTGDVDNPTLNITATENNKAGVSTGSVNKIVDFTCGVKITKTLENMGFQFIINAEDDRAVQLELNAMSPEERSKAAVTMLTTGMYLSDGNTSDFSMNSALSHFLNSEINKITGSAMRTLDFNVGLDTSTDIYGSMHTDYSFQFAKRFWNNRISVSIGGKISSGYDVPGQNQTFFDNVEVQYRIDQESNNYLRLFYKRAVYDFLEGYIGQYGVGYLWKHKLAKLKEIFDFRKHKPESHDSTQQTTLKTPKVTPVDSVKKSGN